MWGSKNLRNKTRKSTILRQSPTAIDPAQCGAKRMRIELAMLDLRTEHCQLTTRAAHHFASRLRVAHFPGDLALAGMYYTNICLGSETLFGSPGAGLDTRFSGVWAVIHLPRVLQVTGCLQTSCVYTADIFESRRAHPGLFCVVFDPPPCWGGGVKIAKTAIGPEHGARLFRLSGCSIK